MRAIKKSAVTPSQTSMATPIPGKERVCSKSHRTQVICTKDAASHVAGVWGTVSNSHSHRAAGAEVNGVYSVKALIRESHQSTDRSMELPRPPKRTDEKLDNFPVTCSHPS